MCRCSGSRHRVSKDTTFGEEKKKQRHDLNMNTSPLEGSRDVLWVAILSGSVNFGGKTYMEGCLGGLGHYIIFLAPDNKSTGPLRSVRGNAGLSWMSGQHQC